ncbi:MAG: serine hydrolase [bacterium]|nr:serine hydrolase [bacterium]
MNIDISKIVGEKRHGLIPIVAMLLLFLVAVAVIMESEYHPPMEGKSQVASASDTRDEFAELDIKAVAAIVVDLKNGKVLYEKNQNVQLPLASLAKIALALAVDDVLPADTVITISRDTAPKGSAERLAKGDAWRVKDVIDFTLVSSSNEGAEILANASNRAIPAKYPYAPEDFAAIWRMNEFAKQLGLKQTFFLNASGLDISPTLSGAYGSARDVATLFGYAASERLPVFASTAEDGVILTSANGRSTARAFNTNEALGDIPGLMMGKTGITDLAGGNLAVVFDAGLTHPVVAVVLGSTREGRFSDIRQIVTEVRNVLSEQNLTSAN